MSMKAKELSDQLDDVELWNGAAVYSDFNINTSPSGPLPSAHNCTAIDCPGFLYTPATSFYPPGETLDADFSADIGGIAITFLYATQPSDMGGTYFFDGTSTGFEQYNRGNNYRLITSGFITSNTIPEPATVGVVLAGMAGILLCWSPCRRGEAAKEFSNN